MKRTDGVAPAQISLRTILTLTFPATRIRAIFSAGNEQTVRQSAVDSNQLLLFRPPVENKKTERQRSKTEHRNNSKVRYADYVLTPPTVSPQAKEAKMSSVAVGGEGSKISCRICGDTAVKHVHYGGHCCFSCKAFFRYEENKEGSGEAKVGQRSPREVKGFRGSQGDVRGRNIELFSFRRAVNWQNKNNRTFQCKFENKCEITIKNRKTCQSCRFQVIYELFILY